MVGDDGPVLSLQNCLQDRNGLAFEQNQTGEFFFFFFSGKMEKKR